MSKDDFWINSPLDKDQKDWFNNGSNELIDDDFTFTFTDSQSFNFPSPLELPDENIFDDSKQNLFDFPSPTISHRRTPSYPVKPPFNFDFSKQNNNPPVSKVFSSEIIPLIPITHTRQKSSPSAPITLPSDDHFSVICSDKAIKFNPHTLGFIPTKFWPDKEMTFGELVSDFFQRKNNANSRFSHKLYNALRISTHDPFYAEFLGVEWISNTVLKVDKKVFARLLGIKTIDGSLFHQQGNFPSHGFIELDPTEASKIFTTDMLLGVDYENIRLLIHQPGIFIKGCTENALDACKWISTRRR